MDLTLAAAWLALGKVSSEDAIAAASAALDRGLYSESLGQMLFAKPIWAEVGPLFEKALAELGILVPTRPEALRLIAREYARQIVAGDVVPYEGARRIWWDVAIEPQADPSLVAFIGLASEWEDVPQFRPEYEAEIVTEARRLLGSEVDA